MSELDRDADLRRQAVRRVDARRGFYAHATIFVIVNAGLATLNLITSPGHIWFLWPLFGWGIGLAAHGWAVFEAHRGDRDLAIAREIEKLRTRGL
jgi:hypothetical protein